MNATTLALSNTAKPKATRRGCTQDNAGLEVFERFLGEMTENMLMMPIADCVAKLKSLEVSLEASALDAVARSEYRRAEELVRHATDARERATWLTRSNLTFGNGVIAQAIALSRLEAVAAIACGRPGEEKDDAIDWLTSDALSGRGTGATFIACCLAVGVEPNRARVGYLVAAGETKLANNSAVSWDISEIETVQAEEGARAALQAAMRA